MITNVKAKFTNGHIVPLEPLDLEDGAELSVDVKAEPARSDGERMKRTLATIGAWKGRSDVEEMKRRLYEARMIGSEEKPLP